MVTFAFQVTRHERGDHLGVGGDLGVGVQPFERAEVEVVVDVAIERAHHVGPGPTRLLLVERMRVRLGDHADAGPAGVAEHHRDRRITRHRTAQQRVGANRVAQHRGVVAELPDLGGRLVDERQGAVGGASHRAGAKQRVLSPLRELARDRRRIEVERGLVHHEVQARGVAAAHLEAIERRQRDLHREVRVECSGV